jgi:hypothetical protein
VQYTGNHWSSLVKRAGFSERVKFCELTFDEVRFQTVTDENFSDFSRLRAMGSPMMPMPMKPTLGAMFGESES